MVIESGCELPDCSLCIQDVVLATSGPNFFGERGWMSDGSRQWSDAAGSVMETKKPAAANAARDRVFVIYQCDKWKSNPVTPGI